MAKKGLGYNTPKFKSYFRQLALNPNPKGPKIEKIQDLEISSEIENFKRATHQTPIFCGKFCRSRLKISIDQGRILAVWILAPKLPNSGLKIAVDFLGGFFPPVFLQGKRPEKIHQKIHGKIHPGIWSAKFPSDFCTEKPFLDNRD